MVLLLVALGAVNLYLQLGTADPGLWYRRGILAVTVYIVIVPILLLLMWFVVRRRSTIAKWTYVLLMGARIVVTVVLAVVLRQSAPLTSPFGLALNLLTISSIWLLFRRDSRDWFAGKRPIDPEVFR